MAVEATESRTSISFSYDQELVKGESATILARNPDSDEDLEVKKTVKNDGSGAVAFPSGYQGQAEIVVRGSDGGEDKGVIEV